METQYELSDGRDLSLRFFVTNAVLRIKALLRTPLNLVLLLVVPVVLVYGFGFVWHRLPDVLATEAQTDIGYLIGAMFSVGFLTGVFTFMQVHSSFDADTRLLTLGLPARRLFVAYLVLVVSTTLFISGIILFVLATAVPVASPVRAFAALLAGGILYALIGTIIGVSTDRQFEGTLALLFMTDMDAFLGSSLVAVESIGWFLPLYFPRRLLSSAVFHGQFTVPDMLSVSVFAVVLSALLAVTLVIRT